MEKGNPMATNEIEAKYLVTTPMFCGSAAPARAELRLPSFKSVLRFWWRALAWSRLNGDLDAIKREEDALFGSTERGQSRVLMRLQNAPEAQTLNPGEVLTISAHDSRVVGEGARYLGYGVMEAFASRNRGTQVGQLIRACLRAPFEAPFEFTVRMRCRRMTKGQLETLKESLITLGILGGMGAKSRKGYGSLSLGSLRVDGEEAWQAPLAPDALGETIAALSPASGPEHMAEYTALTRDSRHVLATSTKREPVELLDLLGREMVRYRSWGHGGRILGSQSERNFRTDHDLMKAPSHSRQSHPKRIVFGLPHNYGRGPNNQVAPFDRRLDRRASPLFIHIQQCGETPVAVLSFLPARFLPRSKSDISVGGERIRQAPESELYQPVHDFLDRLLAVNRRKESFSNVIEVRP